MLCKRADNTKKKGKRNIHICACVCVREGGGDSDGSDYHHHAAINAVKKKQGEILKPC